MRIKKFTLSKNENAIGFNRMTDHIVHDLYYPQEAQKISIYLIDIRTEYNPSDLIMVLGSGNSAKILPIGLFKRSLVYTNGIYSWDTAQLTEFHFDVRDF